MKIDTRFKLKITGVATFIMLFFICESIEAQTPAGAAHMHRATRRRTAVVVSSATHSKDQQAAAAAAQTPPPAPAPAPAPTPAPQTALPIGTVVTVLPAGCVTLDINNVKYYQSGSNYYMAAYQGNTMVYVTTKLPQ